MMGVKRKKLKFSYGALTYGALKGAFIGALIALAPQMPTSNLFTSKIFIHNVFFSKAYAQEATKEVETSKLDRLFSQLAQEANPQSASLIAKNILKEIRQTENKTVELLMGWVDTAYYERRDYGTALDLLDQVTVLDPNYAEGWNRRATLYFEQNKLALSLKDVERTLALEPRHFGALAGLALILERIGYFERAEETLKRVLEIYPANRNAQLSYLRLVEQNAPTKH